MIFSFMQVLANVLGTRVVRAWHFFPYTFPAFCPLRDGNKSCLAPTVAAATAPTVSTATATARTGIFSFTCLIRQNATKDMAACLAKQP